MQTQIDDVVWEEAMEFLTRIAGEGGYLFNDDGSRRPVTYTDFIDALRDVYPFTLEDFYMEDGIGSHFLAELSEAEEDSGNGMITVLICSNRQRQLGGDLLPGPGFFRLARRLGKFTQAESEMSFWLAEHRRVCVANGAREEDM